MYTVTSLRATPVTPVTEPVTLVKAKEWLNVDHSDDDALITDLITSCRQFIEKATNQKVVPHTVVQRTTTTTGEEFPLHYGNATGLAIESLDSTGTLTTLDADQYYQADNNINVYSAGSYRLTYTVGADADSDLIEGIKMLIAYRYNNRGDQEKQQGIPDDVQKIIDLNLIPCL